jgi:uncharacterized protein (DUF2237 family)
MNFHLVLHNFTRPERSNGFIFGGRLPFEARPFYLFRGQHPRHRHCNCKRKRYDAVIANQVAPQFRLLLAASEIEATSAL